MSDTDFNIKWGLELHLGVPSANTAQAGNAAAAVFSEIIGVTNFSMPPIEGERVDVTHFKSPGRKKQYTSGLKDGADASFTCHYVPGSATDTALRTYANSGGNVFLKAVIPTTATGATNSAVTMTWLGVIGSYSSEIGDAGQVGETSVTFIANEDK